MKNFILIVSFALILIAAACTNKPEGPQELFKARQISNKALKEHDLETFSSQWTDDFILISSRGSRFIGKSENINSYRKMFSENPDEYYVRKPTRFELMEEWGTASEFGEWNGEFSSEGSKYKVSGEYSAKWIRDNNEWKIRSEYYLPTQCQGGPLCDQELVKSNLNKAHHAGIVVNDIKSSVEYYTKAFDLIISERIDTLIIVEEESTQKINVDLVFLKNLDQDFVIELIGGSSSDSLLHTASRHIGLTVSDINEYWKRGIELGGEPIRGPRKVIANETVLFNAFLKGPDGEEIELLQWVY